MIPVEGHKNLYRDEKSGAIINTDSHGFSQYKKSRKLKLTQREELDNMKKDIEEIDQKYLKGLKFIYVNNMSDVISHSLTNRKVLNPKNIN